MNHRPIAIILFFFFALTQGCSGRAPDSAEQRAQMVRTQITARGITDQKVIAAFRMMPREEFVLPQYRTHAYDDNEVPIGFGQTLDRPIENATMMQALDIDANERVLEVGTGVGLLASLLGQVAKEVYTIEIDPKTAAKARENITRLGFSNIRVKTGDGFVGWAEHAPFDAIVMTCSPNRIPDPIAAQLAEGGRLIIPLGSDERFQDLILFEKQNGKLIELSKLIPAQFVPMKGKIRDS